MKKDHTKIKQLKATLKLLAKQDELTQKAIYDKHAAKMFSVCRNFISDKHVAEEVMNNGFVKIFFNSKKYTFQGSFEGWMRKIMVRECLSFLRKKKKIDYVYDEKLLQVSEKQETDTPDVRQLIDRLPEEFKIVFNLYAIEGYKHQEISGMLAISENTSKTRLFRARKLLKEQLTIKKK